MNNQALEKLQALKEMAFELNSLGSEVMNKRQILLEELRKYKDEFLAVEQNNLEYFDLLNNWKILTTM